MGPLDGLDDEDVFANGRGFCAACGSAGGYFHANRLERHVCQSSHRAFKQHLKLNALEYNKESFEPWATLRRIELA